MLRLGLSRVSSAMTHRVRILPLRSFSALREEQTNHNSFDNTIKEAINKESINKEQAIQSLNTAPSADIEATKVILNQAISDVKIDASKGLDAESVSTLSNLVNTVEPNGLLIALVVKQLYKSEEFQNIVKLIETIPTSITISPTTARTFDELKKMCPDGGDLDTQIATLMELKKSGISPDLITLKTAVVASSNIGDWVTALKLMDELRKKSNKESKESRMYKTALQHVKKTCEENNQTEFVKILNEEINKL